MARLLHQTASPLDYRVRRWKNRPDLICVYLYASHDQCHIPLNLPCATPDSPEGPIHQLGTAAPERLNGTLPRNLGEGANLEFQLFVFAAWILGRSSGFFSPPQLDCTHILIPSAKCLREGPVYCLRSYGVKTRMRSAGASA
jgi:hypothetical protein